MTTDKQQAVLPTIAEIEDAKYNCERFENATKELQSAHESAYSSGMVEGERVCIGRIAELEQAIDVALEALEEISDAGAEDWGKRRPCVQQAFYAIAKLREVRK